MKIKTINSQDYIDIDYVQSICKDEEGLTIFMRSGEVFEYSSDSIDTCKLYNNLIEEKEKSNKKFSQLDYFCLGFNTLVIILILIDNFKV